MRILGTTPAPTDGLPADAPRGREAERILAGELLAEVRAQHQTLTAFVERLAGRITNHVLEVGTRTFDSTGQLVRAYGTPAGCIEVTNLAPAVAAAAPASTHPANPGAGAEVSITVPAGQIWQLQSIDLTLTTSAAVANRQVQLIIDDGVNELWRFLVTVTQAATLTYLYVWGGSTNDAAVRAATGVNEVLSELPALTLGAGYRIRTVTVAKDAADQYSAITVGYQLTSTTDHTITVASAAPASSVPTAGTGVYRVPAGATRVIPLAARELTIYGVVGDTFSFSVFSAGPVPAVT